MSDAERLMPADPVATRSLSRRNGRKRVHDADEYMARIAAERLVREFGAFRFRSDEKTGIAVRWGRHRAELQGLMIDFRARFLDASAAVVREMYVSAESVEGAVALLDGMDWPRWQFGC